MAHRRVSDSGPMFMDGVRKRFLSADDVEKKDQPAMIITEDIDQFRKLKQSLRARGAFTMAAANLHMSDVIELQLKGMKNLQTKERNDEVIAGMSLPHLSSPKCPSTRSNGIYRPPKTHRKNRSETDASALLSMVPPCPPSSSLTTKNSTAMKSPRTQQKSKSDTALMGTKTPVKVVSPLPSNTPTHSRSSCMDDNSRDEVTTHSRSSSMDVNSRDEILSQLQASIKQAQTPTKENNENLPWKNNAYSNNSIQKTPTKSNKFELSPPRKSSRSTKKSSLAFRPTNKFSVTISDRSTRSGRKIF
mmetsp:Transcript_15841/g.21736  ORF Transcript_15841/g.21736 Transcript_15841/m.21736 type:complete len:303 (-) Transcript_15841:153-1061(-)|eukprot:CAMPEP_0185732592 /NCGR_PEP_ID=MMETSP1171-20130828/16754_1 /TAXON_ID=374046 /ORGANISM="Helicotheca tamensis, Strain CCMP826" /LENGTH=302 /DNA_ID=CAMNT_0028402117 /DNA_START=72 /DNA_END=980 /DNA_ORIENTATION=+